jgi:exodeoxyribonuclease VII small subunit
VEEFPLAKKKSSSRKSSAAKAAAGGEPESDRPGEEKTSPAAAEPSFEDRLAEVEAIVTALETGQLPLDEALKQYERGVTTLRECHEHLSRVERRVEWLAGFDAEGQPLTETLETDESGVPREPGSAPATRSRRRGLGDQSTEPQEGDWEIDGGPELF